MIEGFVEHLGPTSAEVALFIEDKVERFFMPRANLDSLNIGEGDGFWFDSTTGNISAFDPVPVECPDKYDSPDELSRKAGRLP